MVLGLSEPLQSLVHKSYNRAKASSALSFASSEVHVLHTSSNVPFQLRFCPTLAKKPTANKDNDTKPKHKIDPFDNPTGDLFVTDLPLGDQQQQASHVLVLNKFPIIPHHFILATRQFREQTDDLECADLQVTYDCLQSWPRTVSTSAKAEGELFAFFNSGPHSGASQPHRHIQFLPVEDMARDFGAERSWSLLIGSNANLKGLPVTLFQEDIPGNVHAEQLHATYKRLLGSCREAWSRYCARLGASKADFSYNLGMTTTSMVIVSRVQEGVVLRRDDGSEIGYAALNGTLLGGTLMVKKQEEWDYLRQKTGVLDGILESICLPARHEKI